MGFGGGGLSLPKQKYSAPLNEMKPISSYGLGLMFLARSVSIFLNFIFDQLKEPAAGGYWFFASKFLDQTSAEFSPPRPNILETCFHEKLLPFL